MAAARHLTQPGDTPMETLLNKEELFPPDDVFVPASQEIDEVGGRCGLFPRQGAGYVEGGPLGSVEHRDVDPQQAEQIHLLGERHVRDSVGQARGETQHAAWLLREHAACCVIRCTWAPGRPARYSASS
jgi:hypothetical protein